MKNSSRKIKISAAETSARKSTDSIIPIKIVVSPSRSNNDIDNSAYSVHDDCVEEP